MLGGRSLITFDFELNAILTFCLKEIVNKRSVSGISYL